MKKLMSVVLVFAMIICAGVLPEKVAYADNGISLNNPIITPDASMNSRQKVTYDCVWYGSYPQKRITSTDNVYAKLTQASGFDSKGDIEIDGKKYRKIKINDNAATDDWGGVPDGYAFYEFAPIKWRVLKVEEGKALLLSDIVLDCMYRSGDDIGSTTWEKSVLRSWLNGYTGSENLRNKDYSSRRNFINTAFSNIEIEKIVTADITDGDSITHKTSNGPDTKDKVFLLSEQEVFGNKSEPYGFVKNMSTKDESRVCTASEYSNLRGTKFYQSDIYDYSVFWTLRSPAVYDFISSIVDPVGKIKNTFNASSDDSTYYLSAGIRPSIVLDITDGINYAGTVCSDGTVNEMEGETDNNEKDEINIRLVDNSGTETGKSSDEYSLLQYLIVSKLLYVPGVENSNNINKKVSEFLTGDYLSFEEKDLTKRNGLLYKPIWNGDEYKNITFQNLCNSFISDWGFLEADIKPSGFKAAAFLDNNNQVVIAFCGSEEGFFPNGLFNDVSVDWDTDFRFALFDTLGEQFNEVQDFTNKVIEKYGKDHEIVFTGHSLGGALATYESILTDYETISFDGANGHIIDLAYLVALKDNVKSFTGIDNIKSTNYVDEVGYFFADVIQATNTKEFYSKYPDFLSTVIAGNPDQNAYNSWFFKTGDTELNGVSGFNNKLSAYSHDICSIMSPYGSDAVRFNDRSFSPVTAQVWTHDIQIPSKVYDYLFDKPLNVIGVGARIVLSLAKFLKLFSDRSRVMMGTSNSDIIDGSHKFFVNDLLLGKNIICLGDGSDTATGYTGDDFIVIGKGANKDVDGMGGNDCYIVDPNPDSYTLIRDIAGDNRLFLRDISPDDVEVGNNSIYIKSLKQIIDFELGINSKMYVVCGDYVEESGNLISGFMLSSFFGLNGIRHCDYMVVQIDGISNINIFDDNGNSIDTISNNTAGKNNSFKDYGAYYCTNDREDKRIILYLYDGYTMEILGTSSVDLGVAVVEDNAAIEYKKAASVDLSSSDLLVDKDAEKIIRKKTDDPIAQIVDVPVDAIKISDIAIKVGETYYALDTAKAEMEIFDDSVAKISSGKIVGVGVGETYMYVQSKKGLGTGKIVKITVSSKSETNGTPDVPATPNSPNNPNSLNGGSIPSIGSPSGTPYGGNYTPPTGSSTASIAKPDKSETASPNSEDDSGEENARKEKITYFTLFRLYNPDSGEHLYTTDSREVQALVELGWNVERSPGKALSSGVAVFRLYDPASGGHLYTTDKNECKILTRKYGWQYDNNKNPVFYGSKRKGFPVYRLFNSKIESVAANHHYTSDEVEIDSLVTYEEWQYDNERKPVFYLK